MHLKKLQLQGFKTFAEKTEIGFSEGVTAIVGPNGSGKSNLADAILWVLGEQKASALRGAKSADVIFSGSDKRRQSGMAEVSLTVDNSDGTLPLDFDEVTITRRAYRTGDSEYFLNKVACRLKDIYELFLDTGVGREAYSLVNQSEIDAVLSVNPEDRRGLFEEAAGIKRYRVKKREALRKLDATEANLLRVNDILGEISGRLEPLRVQAERAEQFIRLRERLRAIESTLLIIDVRNLSAQLTEARTQKEQNTQQAILLDEAVQQAEIQATTLGHELAAADTQLEQARHAHQAALSHAERAESQRALAAQRLENLAATLSLSGTEQEELAARQTDLAERQASLEAELATLRHDEIAGRAVVADRQAHLDALDDQVRELTRSAERARAQSLALSRQQATRQSELARAEARVAELESSLPALIAERERLESLVTAEQEHARTQAAEADRTRATLQEAEADVATAQTARDQARQGVHASQQAANAAAGKRVSISTRLRTLQDLEDAQEGYYGGVRAVFDAVRRGHLTGEYVVVADRFQSPSGFEMALETALGGSLQDIITGSEAEAKAAIALLHDLRAGRATFLPLNRLRPPRDLVDLGRLAGTAGVCGTALELITYDQRYGPALEVLLGRVFVCETLDHALRATPQVRSWSRAVTLAGEIVLPSGALTGGRQAGRGAGQLLGRKTEIANLQQELRGLERDFSAAQAAADQSDKDRDRAESALAEAHAARQTAQLALTDVRRRVDLSKTELRRLEEALGHASRRSVQAEQQLEQARAAAASAAAALASGGQETAGVDTALDEDAARLRDLGAQRDQRSADLTTARIALATQSEKATSVDRALRTVRAELDQARMQLSRKSQTQQDAQREHDSLVQQSAQREAESTLAASARDHAQLALAAAAEARHALVQQVAAASAAVRQQSEQRAAALEAAHRCELKETRVDVQRTQIAARLADEYEISMEQALALPENPSMEDGAASGVNRLRRDIRQMGEVNTAAVEEYAELKTRHDFMTTQRADLQEAKDKLLAGIKEIDESTRGVFMETFHAVGAAFDRIFTRLFGGGKTDLVLTNPDDLLETGIEILVQPPGKKRQNLALLSGGERALTATALLFAFLDVKPSPFCVMDEVDAPLDGANVERFADLLEEFGRRSQFIIITHNPTTMEAAPMWYGVTMQEPGISRVLSMQVPEGAETHRSAAAKPRRAAGARGASEPAETVPA